MTRPATALLRCLGAVTVVAAVASCSTAAGSSETDRVASTVATAISYPRQDSVDGLVRAALQTGAGQDARLTVVEATSLRAPDVADPLARLVFRIHLAGTGSGFSSVDPVTACYRAEFNYYGVIGSPRRTTCPSGAVPVVPPPPAPRPVVAIPPGFDRTLAELLRSLPAESTAADVQGRVTSRLPVPAVDPETGLRGLPPTVDAAVDGRDVGVSLWAAAGRGCLLGARVAGEVVVWRPSRVQLQPGELSCTAQTAVDLQGTAPPH